ncbi:Alpha-L-fucosidase [compost metagenome]
MLQDVEKIAEKSQQVDDGEFSRALNSMDEDLGSRKAIAEFQGDWVWYPAEVNTSIRPGWFYHEAEDDQVRSDRELFDIYVNAVGGNATFLLNIPPNREGLIAEPDREVLVKLGRRISALNDNTLSRNALVTVSSLAAESGAAITLTGRLPESYWKPAADDREPWICLSLPEAVEWNTIVLQEHILSGQRVEGFEVWAEINDEWQQIAADTIIGYKKILRVQRVRASRLKLVFKQFREFPTMAHIKIVNIEDENAEKNGKR